MKGLNLTPHFKYSTNIYCQNRDICSINIPTRSRSFHENGLHVQGWNPTTINSKIAKDHFLQKSKNG